MSHDSVSGSDFSPGWNADTTHLPVTSSITGNTEIRTTCTKSLKPLPFSSSLARRRKSDSEIVPPSGRNRTASLFSRLQDRLHVGYSGSGSSQAEELNSTASKGTNNYAFTHINETDKDNPTKLSKSAGTATVEAMTSSSSNPVATTSSGISSEFNVGSSAAAAAEDSTDSENDPEPSQAFKRQLSTNKAIKNIVSLKEGYLLKQTSSFQRWHRRYFKIKGKTLYYGKDEKAQIFDEISLTDLTIAESSSKTFKHGFQVITPFRVLMLAAETRTVMDDWIHAIRAASDNNFYEAGDHSNLLSGSHVWYATSHARPTYCNICREQLCGVTSQGLSCEICKFKTHKRCASKALNNCKWTTLASMGRDIIEEVDGTLCLPHQWLEGNLPVSAKCEVCERTCGSVLRLQDWRCLWCRVCVHTACRPIICQKCPVGRISVVPPTALHTIGSDDAWETSRSLSGCSPLLVFVNSKSGDHQGLKFLRRFKQLLNPAQVFDLVNGGPRRGLEFFRHFEPFRILVCGGDGSVGWVMSEIDKLSMHRQCQVGVVPLGTGNDLARVLGWGASCDDDAHLPHLLEKYEKATTKMLDRWSVMTFERGVVLKPSMSRGLCLTNSKPQISQYEDSVVSHLQNILQSDQHQSVITSAKVLCETVRDMIGKIGASAPDSEIDEKCATLSQKLDSLLQTLHEETENTNYVLDEDEHEVHSEEVQEWRGSVIASNQISASPAAKKLTKFRQRDTLMSRANSLKKAVRQIIEHAERTIDDQNSSPPIVVVRPMSLAVSPSPEEVISIDYFQKATSPIDPDLRLPVPSEFADQMLLSVRRESVGDESKVQRDHSQSEKSEAELLSEMELASAVGSMNFPKIEVESPSSSSATKSPSEVVDFCDGDLSSSVTDDFERASLSPPTATHSFLTVPGSSPGSPNNSLNTHSSSSSPTNQISFPRGSSPRASRRVSMGSLFKPLEVEIPKSPNSKRSSFEMMENHFFSSPSSHSNSPSPNKMSQNNGKKTLPIINPLVSHPAWPTIASGGIVSKVLLANADAMCCVASPLMDPEDEEDLMIGFEEKCVLNNYFGIGIDAKITLDFHMKREEHPEKCRSRTKNFMWYGVLGSKEYLQQTCKNLEQRVQLECDGKVLPLPSLQGIVILNIQSFMGGTNFWGGTKEDDCFLAPSFDDRILEVVAVFDSMQMAASRLINLQHHRIAQCHSIKITLLGDEPIPVQVDGEAWLQPPGVIKIIHKNRMQMLCRNRALESSLKSWEEKQKLHLGGISPTSTETEELDKKRHSRRLFSLGKLRDHKGKEGKRGDVTPDGGSDGFSEEAFSSEVTEVAKWTLADVGDWLDHLQLGEYKYNFSRHDIQGAELLCLQRRDIKDLGITKVGHIKRILQGIDNLLAENKT